MACGWPLLGHPHIEFDKAVAPHGAQPDGGQAKAALLFVCCRILMNDWVLAALYSWHEADCVLDSEMNDSEAKRLF